MRSLALAIACDIHPLNNLRVLKYLKGPLALSEEQKDEWYRHWVAEGLEALEALQGPAYTVVLMDCQMPELDGYETTQVIRAQEAGGKRQPIVATTATNQRKQCLEAGMDDYLRKPLDLPRLKHALERWLILA